MGAENVIIPGFVLSSSSFLPPPISTCQTWKLSFQRHVGQWWVPISWAPDSSLVQSWTRGRQHGADPSNQAWLGGPTLALGVG